jgi:porin
MTVHPSRPPASAVLVPGTLLVLEALLVATGDARAASIARDDAAAGRCGAGELPGEYPRHRFRSPFPPAIEEEQDFRDKYLFGDWLGLRPILADHGVKATVLFITDPFGNVLGGLRRGASDYNLVGVDLLLDTHEVLGWCGGQFHVGFADNFGVSLSRRFVGNGFPIQLADVADTHVRLTYLSYTQSLLDDRLSIRFGRLTINSVFGQEFLGSEYFKAFTSVGLDLVPLGIFLNAPGAFGYPDTTWGARLKVEPVTRFYFMAGVYNGDPSLKAGEKHGVDFSMDGPPFAIAEVGFRRNYGEEATGLAGNLKLGAYEDAGRYGVYVVADQELWRLGPSADRRHLGAFGGFVFTPERSRNPVPVFVDAGLVFYGPSGARPKDFAGFAVVYASYTAKAPATDVPDFEMTIEWTYGLKLRPGLVLQPDIQYIIHPSGDPSIPNALAIGLNAVVNL